MMISRPAVAALAVLAAASPARAKGNPDPALPRPIRAMYRLVGDWSTRTGQMTIDGKKHEVRFAVSCAPASAGVAIACQGHFDIDTHDHVALPPADGQPVVFAYSGVVAGQPMHEVLSFTFDADGRKLALRVDQLVGGKPAAQFTASMVKQ